MSSLKNLSLTPGYVDLNTFPKWVQSVITHGIASVEEDIYNVMDYLQLVDRPVR